MKASGYCSRKSALQMKASGYCNPKSTSLQPKVSSYNTKCGVLGQR
jgi:hypothetical protein